GGPAGGGTGDPDLGASPGLDGQPGLAAAAERGPRPRTARARLGDGARADPPPGAALIPVSRDAESAERSACDHRAPLRRLRVAANRKVPVTAYPSSGTIREIAPVSPRRREFHEHRLPSRGRGQRRAGGPQARP